MLDSWMWYRVNSPGEDSLSSLVATLAERGLTTIADIGGQVRSGFAGFSACALNPHTDRSGIVNPPALLMMACGQPATTGGECVVIDGQAVYDDLAEVNPKTLDELAQFSPETARELPVLRATIDRQANMFRLDAGQGYILDNCRWLHGRRAFSGRRVMYRVNANPLASLRITPGFLPSPILTPEQLGMSDKHPGRHGPKYSPEYSTLRLRGRDRSHQFH